MEQALQILNEVYGYADFRKGQKDVIQAIIAGSDTLAILPTGGGKSICYQIPSQLLKGTTLVVSPLISLMKDQVDALKDLGIASTYINSSLNRSETNARLRAIANGEYDLVYIAPERLEADDFKQLINMLTIPFIAIDEAHCISQWGHDFRPSYMKIRQMIDQLPVRPTLAAFTATATDKVVDDIASNLGMDQPTVIKTGYARENLAFSVWKGTDKFVFLREFLQVRQDQSGIVYASTRKEVDAIHKQLVELGYEAGKYHAGMGEHARTEEQEKFLYDRNQIIVATNAFGMGIDKSNVRFVVHYNMPKNIEAYYQEAGRAGRDGEPGECVLLFSARDIMVQKFLIEQSFGNEERKAMDLRHLRTMVNYCRTDSCLQAYIVRYFGDYNYGECENCANCTDERELQDMTVEAQKVFSCVRRMGERFGATLTAKVLKGSRDKKVKQFEFNQLSTYGIMKELKEREIMEFINVLVADGYLQMADSKFPVLSLTNRAVEVLTGTEKVFRKVERVQQRTEGLRDDLFEQLRALRTELATQEGIPPFMVLHDAALRSMCELLPQTEAEMQQVKGMGAVKMEKYGEQFLTIVASYEDSKVK